MPKHLSFLITIVILLTTGCSERHLIRDKNYRQQVHKDFLERNSLAINRKEQLFSVLKGDLPAGQSEALEFLFAYMPLNDLADYNGEFFRALADASLKAKKERPWGKNLPDDIFLHYVLPYRVNNENLDSFRLVYYDELSGRIKGLGIKEAALEINHWCHEKVAYQPSDIRTSSPMNTILSARGRCGEESTFTVSALRTAGIPARQVYCPRWAHTDDNHAWVEFWADGKWYYMGACEPEPLADRGWFTEPARRAMLVHTKSFGAPYGNENYIKKYRLFSEVNNLSKYAVTKRIYAKVTDTAGRSVKDALVAFRIYNYSEFFTLAEFPTGDDGLCSFETGIGDLIVWARKGDDFGFSKISACSTDTVFLELRGTLALPNDLALDLLPPAAPVPLAGPSGKLMKQNSLRVAQEDTIRQKYISSWMKPEEAASFAAGINADTAATKSLLMKSMGNYRAVSSFLLNTPPDKRNLAVGLLEKVAEKDLRDVSEPVFMDHLVNIRNPYNLDTDDDLYRDYVLNPRVANEVLSGWRSYLLKNIPAEIQSEALINPLVLRDYINTTIKVADDENYYRTPITPSGVDQLKVSDSQSRSIYFVAICRSIGIPSRLEPGTGTPQFWLGSGWTDVRFHDQRQATEKKGFISFTSSAADKIPEYYINFTLARFENGDYHTLEYDYNKKATEFGNELPLAPGRYLLITGNRLNDSKILAGLHFFELLPDQHIRLDIEPRK
jgi:transglutaminase-like putative cysteine protease